MTQELSEEEMRAYLNGKLSPSEKSRMEKVLQDNPDLQQELSLLRAEIASAELLIASETRQLFQQWQQAATPRHSVFKSGPLRWAVGILLSLLLLLTGYCLFQQWSSRPTDTFQHPAVSPEIPVVSGPVASSTAPSPDTLSAKQPNLPNKEKNYPALAASLMDAPQMSRFRQSSKMDTVSSFNQAEAAFAAGNYQKTLDLLNQPDSTRQQSTLFLSAHALFQLHRYKEAELRFENLVVQNSRQFRFRSEWGLLMCRLADWPHREKAFEQQLNDILRQPEHPYWHQAVDLRKTLKK